MSTGKTALVREAVRDALDRVACSACSTCGFFDPRQTAEFTGTVEAIAESLTTNRRFRCHKNFKSLPGTPEENLVAPTCVGFAAVRTELERHGLAERPKGELLAAVADEVRRRGKNYPCIPPMLLPHEAPLDVMAKSRAKWPLHPMHAAGEAALFARFEDYEDSQTAAPASNDDGPERSTR